MCPLGPRAKNVSTPPAGAAAGAAVSTPPRLIHAPVNRGSPDDGSAAEFSHSALSRPRQATVSVPAAITAAGPPRHVPRFGPSGCQPVLSDRMYSTLLVLVATNSGCAGVTP